QAVEKVFSTAFFKRKVRYLTISSLPADAFRGACLQLILTQRSIVRMDFQTALIPSESPPFVLQST
ncbi:hypothetical protein, partial [Salipaludibacillus aurantiacus]|uniref:hypothetical protein n=1 Tax=Salipaludibacillus aurantiacus TaxID=1601833 RepID=UPI001C435736